ncbi:unnamed protein product [Polarella glacialis]|uniref:Uncharacterized protein n=1 Tax=Polarella glacialis TaxID=89957 RepID=A0A813DXN7_POLGL|nr:unnamed protein product [Polarella glacialis]
MAPGVGGDAEEWLVMALRAADRVAVGPKAARAARWQAFEVSYEHFFGVVHPAAGDTPGEDLESVLAQVKEVTGRQGKVTVVQAKEWMRSFGAEGTRAASELSRLSKARNASAHSLALQLLVTVRQLGQCSSEPEAELCEGREALAGQVAARCCSLQGELDSLRADLACKSADCEAVSVQHAQVAAEAARELEQARSLVDQVRAERSSFEKELVARDAELGVTGSLVRVQQEAAEVLIKEVGQLNGEKDELRSELQEVQRELRVSKALEGRWH